MAKTFHNPIDAIEKARYRVGIPEWYNPAGLHWYYEATGEEPFYQTDEQNEAQTMLSPFKIVKAIAEGAWIRFFNDDDRFMVLLHINNLISLLDEGGGIEQDGSAASERQLIKEDAEKAYNAINTCNNNIARINERLKDPDGSKAKAKPVNVLTILEKLGV